MAAPASSAAAPSATSSLASIPGNLPAGGITITQPAQTAAPSYYKIAQGVNVTFGWNFTSVVRQPQSLYVQAYCSDNLNTYPIAPTGGISGDTTEVIWNPYAYGLTAAANNQPALIQATYRLQIFDERGLGVGASPGLFTPNEKVQFALYIPQTYTPISEGWICGSCNGADGFGLWSRERGGALIGPLALGMVATTLSAAVGGWGLMSKIRMGRR